MNIHWQKFLQGQNARIVDGVVQGFGEPPVAAITPPAGDRLVDLSHLDVLEIDGTDAAAFLHSQFSSEVSTLAQNAWQASSWCNIKGRVIASFLLYRGKQAFYLLLERELSETLEKRLRMFVLRAKVNIRQRSDDLVRIGIRGASAHDTLHTWLRANPVETVSVLSELPGSEARSIVICPAEPAAQIWRQVSTGAGAADRNQWSVYDITAGLPWVGEAGSEEFLPQSLNLDLIGGLSFSKGCYPGQEIIARMHFRGKLKQRLFLASVASDETAAIKTRVFVEDVAQHAGMVVNAVMSGPQTCLLLVILELAYAGKSRLHLGDSAGPLLTLLPLPYAVDMGTFI